MTKQHGLIVLFGSGEIAPSGRKVHDWVMRQLSPPIRVAILETPAGFQPNSDLVAGKMADFLSHSLQNHNPQVTVIPARKRGTPFSPDDPEIVSPLLHSNYIFWGPGSPTYAARQLKDSLAWQMMVSRHRLGATMVMASAAAIASGAHTLPVYEIYKVGEDLHWLEGLDFFGAYGLSLAIVSHWDNTEGGAELDTRCGLMGRDRFQQLMSMLPGDVTVVGIDEHTALVLDLEAGDCQVLGRGTVTLVRGGRESQYTAGQGFAVSELGPFRLPEEEAGVSRRVWEQVLAAETESQDQAAADPPAAVLSLVEEREAARTRRDWAASDDLRERIAAAGWEVRDTSSGPELAPL
jgi:hypothetical protein